MSGAAVTAGQFGAWTPIGAEPDGKRLSGRLEERRRRSVRRVEHRQQRQLSCRRAPCCREPAWRCNRSRRLRPEFQRRRRRSASHDGDRIVRCDHPGQVTNTILCMPTARPRVRSLKCPARPSRRASSVRGRRSARSQWGRLFGSSGRTARRSVPRVERRQQRQLALAEHRGVRREHRAASARTWFQPGFQWRRCDRRRPPSSSPLARRR